MFLVTNENMGLCLYMVGLKFGEKDWVLRDNLIATNNKILLLRL